MKRLALAPALVLLLIPAAAEAKGTNVRISSAPNGTDAGESWSPLITINMPGAGRVEGVRPRVIIRRGVMRRSFATKPTGRRGVYRARVVFPSRGRWRYGVDDGLDRFEPGAGRVHGFPPVRIAPGEPTLPKAPLPISGEVDVDVNEPGFHGPEAVLPPETTISPAPNEDGGGSGWATAALVLGGLGVAAGTVITVRRRKPIGTNPSD